MDTSKRSSLSVEHQHAELRRRKQAEEPGKIGIPKPVISKSMKNRSKLFKFLAALIFLYAAVPLAVYFSPAVRRHAVFLNYVSLSRQRNLSLPHDAGLSCARSFYIPSGGDVKLGAWHVPPHSVLSKCRDGLLPSSEEFNDNRPVFLYLHGNAGTRGGGHRVELYQVLSKDLDAHVIAFDYRGYGDSSNVSPTETGVVEDTAHVYRWLLKRVDSSRIYIWGHSLGTGVGVAFLHKISNSAYQPAALILEAPFTRIIDAAKHHPLSILHRYMPYFDFFIAEPIGDKDTGFDSLSRIGNVKCPLLILHAKDDGFVPYEHSETLMRVVRDARKDLPPKSAIAHFVGFESELNLGHKNICRNPELPTIISKFMRNIQHGK